MGMNLWFVMRRFSVDGVGSSSVLQQVVSVLRVSSITNRITQYCELRLRNWCKISEITTIFGVLFVPVQLSI